MATVNIDKSKRLTDLFVSGCIECNEEMKRQAQQEASARERFKNCAVNLLSFIFSPPSMDAFDLYVTKVYTPFIQLRNRCAFPEVYLSSKTIKGDGSYLYGCETGGKDGAESFWMTISATPTGYVVKRGIDHFSDEQTITASTSFESFDAMMMGH